MTYPAPMDAVHLALYERSPVQQLALLLAQELVRYAPAEVDDAAEWATDRARNMAGWVTPDSTAADVERSLCIGTVRGSVVHGLPVHPRAVGVVVMCVGRVSAAR